MRVENIINTLEELDIEAVRFARGLVHREEGATLVTLSGELGAGKTAFVKAVARFFGIEEIVNSPTFVLEKIYALPHKLGHPMSKFVRLVHIDAYRLEKGSELSALGFDEIMQDSHNLVMLEWPERVSESLPEASTRLTITLLADGSRKFQYE